MPGFRVDIQQDPRRIFPPQFNLLRCQLPGIFPHVITPFRYAETIPFPADQAAVMVHHADGADEVPIQDYGDELSAYAEVMRGSPDRPCPAGADQAVGFSKNLRFDEAFAQALASLPQLELPGADVLARVQVMEIGGLFGGIAGFRDLFVPCLPHPMTERLTSNTTGEQRRLPRPRAAKPGQSHDRLQTPPLSQAETSCTGPAPPSYKEVATSHPSSGR